MSLKKRTIEFPIVWVLDEMTRLSTGLDCGSHRLQVLMALIRAQGGLSDAEIADYATQLNAEQPGAGKPVQEAFTKLRDDGKEG